MLDVRYFLANLLCVFIPLFGIEVWRHRNGKTVENKNAFWSIPVLVSSIVLSSILCTFFNFAISKGITLNLSIVPLTIGFFVLPWAMGLLILTLYIIFNIIFSIFILSNGHFTLQVVTTILSALPQALVILVIFAVLMCTCSIRTRGQSFSMQATGFVTCLLLYTLIDFAYVHHIKHFTNFNFMAFAGFMVVINFTFIVAARLLIAAKSAHLKRLEDVRIEKLELISQIAASVAHEIRNPITVVQGFTQLLQQKDYDKDKMHEFLQIMQEELARAESVIADYLQIAKGPVEDSYSELNLSLLVDHIIKVLQPYAVAKNVTLKSSTDMNLIINGNQMSVTQAIMNLTKNAIEAHEHTGTVEVKLKSVGGFVELKIMDSGRGIPASEVTKLGQPYYSTKTKGTGLGLTLVYKVISEINGKIQVQSQEGKGTTFTITIPRVKQTESESALVNPTQLAH